MTAPAPILLIEDTPPLQLLYETLLTLEGHKVTGAVTAADGWQAFRATRPRVVILDLMLPDRDGLDLLQDMLREDPAVRVIVITANGSISKAVAAMRAGAQEFLVKPFDGKRLVAAVSTALSQFPAPVTGAATTAEVPGPPGDLIGTSPAMERVYATIRSVAPSMATVFITGESGTGKELCAQAIHDLSGRAAGPFIALNCGAIPSDLLESEVFGHLKGSFTGAIADKPGAATAADGGTLFLDEICEMDLALQTKLLRFLQTSTVTPVGATKPRKVDVRIVCATNRDPLEAVRAGRFREDLYYRLHVVPIHMPPLRDRGEDVITIAETVLARYSVEEGRGFTALSPGVKSCFRDLPWPGNVRQLLNVLRNVVVLNAEGSVVTEAMLPADLRGIGPSGVARPAELHSDDLIGRPLAEIEQIVIEATLARCDGSVPKAARLLEVSPSTLYRKLEGWRQEREAAE
ncbi:sigma-54-dependent transcriptional regulator [Acidimangrovimonas sediminis]|uniref:sigma-54-dependent transcriptional regulator n=1 Tax=Acidimangrovimonas sediminis TaxID=2056283 RepID=UPI000C80F11B|nr:sigma-54 dependent transcriptional regulator [Acidimangrovimonas sediminis]